MPENYSENQERLAVVEELSELLQVVQEMGRRLSNETHGNAYDLVQDLNAVLQQARRQITLIEAKSRKP
jgi:hypothetical protein